MFSIKQAASLDRFNDLQKQGFMKPAKHKKKTLYQAWLPNEEGLCYEGESEIPALLYLQRYGATIKKVRK